MICLASETGYVIAFFLGVLVSALVFKTYKDDMEARMWGPDGKWLDPVETRKEIQKTMRKLDASSDSYTSTFKKSAQREFRFMCRRINGMDEV